MASYSQWRAGKREPFPVTLVCGLEEILVREVTDTIRGKLSGAVTEVFHAGHDPEPDIWASCGQLPEPDTKRLVVVRDAQRLRKWDSLRYILDAGRDFPDAYLLFVFGTDDFAKDDNGLIPPASWCRDSSRAQIIRCSGLPPDGASAWLAQNLPQGGPAAAFAVLNRCGGNLTAAYWACQKLAFTGVKPTDSAIATVCPPRTAQHFADLLCLYRKPEALLAASQLDPDSSVLGMLARNLDWLSRLHPLAGQKLSMADLMHRTGIRRPDLISQFMRVASNYSPDKVTACRRLLAVTEDAWLHGTRDGICEYLAAQW